MDKKNSMLYLYNADIVFIEIHNGIYLVGKDKVAYDLSCAKGQYVSTDVVINRMNIKYRKVAICKESIDNLITANFEPESLASTDLREISKEGYENG